MIVYGVCAGPTAKYDTYAGPGIERVRSPEDPVVVLRDQDSIFSAYNAILDEARRVSADAVILIHDDVELLDARIEEKVWSAFVDESVAILGVIGARDVRSLEWWRYDTHGFVLEDRRGAIDFGRGTRDVEVVDGLFLALSPWTVERLRFDESYGGFHGYDADICFAASAAGGRVVVTDIDLAHRTQGGYGDRAAFDRADARFCQKWGLPGPPTDQRRQGFLTRLARRLRPR